MYDYKARVIKVVDGDTMHLDVDLGIDSRERVTVRLMGINCPEMNTEAGKEARKYAAAWVATNGELDEEDPSDTYFWIRCVTYKDKKEKYGRYLADILPWAVGGPSLNDLLVAGGHAVEYHP